MKTETKVLGGVFILSLILVSGAVFFFGKNEKTSYSDNSQVKGEKVGSDSAKVKLVEFSDLQCPACKIVEPFLKQVRKKYQDDLQFIYRHFPLPQHVHSKKAANFVEYAATEGKFWEVHDKLFETQEEWSSLADPSDYFADLGFKFGLDKDKIKEVISEEAYNNKINDDIAEANRLGVNSTPTFYLNGEKLSLQSFADLDVAISKELKK